MAARPARRSRSPPRSASRFNAYARSRASSARRSVMRSKEVRMSPDEHVDAAAFVAYVEGRLPLLDQQTLEAHVERCSRCALALQHAAAREEALFELAAAL